jgi:pyroglutamyl-peptidase
MSNDMRVAIAGFGPFPGAPFNPSAALAQALRRRRRPALAGLARTPHVFATAYAAVDRDLAKLFAGKPDVVLIFGLAARRRQVCVETRARNAVSVLFPDVSGYRPHASVIAPRKPPSQRGNAPFAHLLAAARTGGMPARLSRDAGRYLCNYAYWQALQRARDGTPLIAFVHIPRTRLAPARMSKRLAPSLPQLVRAAEAILIALASAHRSITARRSA